MVNDAASPKDRLTKHAEFNPRQVLVISEVNGQFVVDISYATPAEALFMLYTLEKSTKEIIERQLNALQPKPAQG